MCKNAQSTAASLMIAIEPTLKNLLSFAGLATSDIGKAAIAAYDAALAGIEGWKQGTIAQNILQLIQDFQGALTVLPIPGNITMLLNIILAGVETVIGVITANSPAPVTEAVPIGVMASTEELQAMHQAAVIHETTMKVKSLVPQFKLSKFHSPSYQYTKTWNDAVTANGLPQTLHIP